jgi:Effector Associated Constant Component 1
MELSGTVQLTVAGEADRDRYWLAEETTRLRRELRPYAAKPAADETRAEEDARGTDPTILNSLVVQLGPALESLGGLLNAVLVWVGARPQRTVHVKINDSEIDICGATPEESRELIQAFVQSQRRAIEAQSHAKPVEKGKHK